MRIPRKTPTVKGVFFALIKRILTLKTLRRLLSIVLFMLWDAASAVMAVIIGFGLHFGLSGLADSEMKFLFQYAELSVIIMLAATIVSGCYTVIWRRAGIGQFTRILIAAVIATAVMSAFIYAKQLPLSTEFISVVALFELLFMLMARAFVRFSNWLYIQIAIIKRLNKMKRVLIYGAGKAGTELMQKLQSHPEDNLRPVCFIDDDKSLWGTKIGGLRVIGGKRRLERAIKDYAVKDVIVAIGSADSEMLKELLIKCHRMHCHLKRFGILDDVDVKSLEGTPISEINLEDLLRRNSVKLNMRVVRGFIEGKTVLVTGGAGSIGSEICRQVLYFGAKRLIVFDISENGLFNIQNELGARFKKERFVIRLGSIRDKARVEEIFENYRPDVVFHAAAHKHVPMMEFNPLEAVKNNVFGTINVAQSAISHGAEKFILISTDKAVNPANIMGATKRIAEIAVQTLNRGVKTDLAAVRFGNVLGSSGSVVPFFKKQIENGGPVTVTHPKMRRYFMTIPEAVQLVLEAGAMAGGGEIFVLDMGKPVYIYDLACDLIRLSGYEPNTDIKIVFTGLRPGEKLFEEISLAGEDVEKTPNNKIFICKPTKLDAEKTNGLIGSLSEQLKSGDRRGVFDCVGKLVPTFCDKKN